MYVLAQGLCLCTDRDCDFQLMYELANFLILNYRILNLDSCYLNENSLGYYVLEFIWFEIIL